MSFPPSKYLEELNDLLGELEAFAKTEEVSSALAERRLNSSFLLLGAQALKLYASGDSLAAAEDFALLSEEIIGRHRATPPS